MSEMEHLGEDKTMEGLNFAESKRPNLMLLLWPQTHNLQWREFYHLGPIL